MSVRDSRSRLSAAIVLCFHFSPTVTFLLPPGNTSAVVCDMGQTVPWQGLIEHMPSVPSDGSELFLVSFLFLTLGGYFLNHRFHTSVGSRREL